MHTKELEYMIIEYSEKDLPYIDTLCEYIKESCYEIISFLKINTFGEKVNVKLWDNLKEFRDYCKKHSYCLDENGKVPKWLCGITDGNIVHTLCLDEYRKTESHENDTLQDLKYLIMHEFTHSCHTKINDSCYSWIEEGLATTITHQMENENIDRVFNFTLKQTMYGGSDYRSYHTMFCYVYETYGKDYILNLIKNNELLKKDTPKLYEETVKMYGNHKIEKETSDSENL